MKFYIERFGETFFDASVTPPPAIADDASAATAATTAAATATPTDSGSESGEKETFYFASPARGSNGMAVIGIHLGHSKKRNTLLLKGSKVSLEVSESWAGSASVKALRASLEKQGILVDGVLMEDYMFSSQSGAGQFLNGTSFDGNGNWKTADGTPLKQLLE